jgi:hypothetical protein
MSDHILERRYQKVVEILGRAERWFDFETDIGPSAYISGKVDIDELLPRIDEVEVDFNRWNKDTDHNIACFSDYRPTLYVTKHMLSDEDFDEILSVVRHTFDNEACSIPLVKFIFSTEQFDESKNLFELIVELDKMLRGHPKTIDLVLFEIQRYDSTRDGNGTKKLTKSQSHYYGTDFMRKNEYQFANRLMSMMRTFNERTMLAVFYSFFAEFVLVYKENMEYLKDVMVRNDYVSNVQMFTHYFNPGREWMVDFLERGNILPSTFYAVIDRVDADKRMGLFLSYCERYDVEPIFIYSIIEKCGFTPAEVSTMIMITGDSDVRSALRFYAKNCM